MSGITRCGSGAGSIVWEEWVPPTRPRCDQEPKIEEEPQDITISSETDEPANNIHYEKVLTVDPYL